MDTAHDSRNHYPAMRHLELQKSEKPTLSFHVQAQMKMNGAVTNSRATRSIHATIPVINSKTSKLVKENSKK